MNPSRLPSQFGRCRPNQNVPPTGPKQTTARNESLPGDRTILSIEAERFRLSPVHRSSEASLVAWRRGSDIGELAAFLSLSVAGCAAIVLAILLSRDFPAEIERATARLAAPPIMINAGKVPSEQNVVQTNRTTLQRDVTSGDAVERPAARDDKLAPDTVIAPAQAPRPSV